MTDVSDDDSSEGAPSDGAPTDSGPINRPTIELTIDELAAGGDGVGRDTEGRVTFVAQSAPGDRLRVELFQQKKAFARGRVVEVLEEGPDRVTPRCPLFVAGTCGGCQWQHVSISAQREAKQHIVASAARKLLDGGTELREIQSPVADWNWRRRARLHWIRPKRSERAIIGFYAPRSERITDITECVQLAEPLMTALHRIRTVLGPHLHKRGELQLLMGASDAIHVVIDGPCAARGVKELVGGSIVGVRSGQRRYGASVVELEGGLEGSADRFAQASHAGNQALLKCVADWLPVGAESALDLFAGSGNLTRALTDAYDRVFACDLVPPAGGPPQGVQWRAGHADRVTAALAGAGVAIDVVVLDPPRSGARECMGPIAKLGPVRVIYVSCDPATMCRDLLDLATAGYEIKWLQPLDLMPQTSQVEVVAVADRVELGSPT